MRLSIIPPASQPRSKHRAHQTHAARSESDNLKGREYSGHDVSKVAACCWYVPGCGDLLGCRCGCFRSYAGFHESSRQCAGGGALADAAPCNAPTPRKGAVLEVINSTSALHQHCTRLTRSWHSHLNLVHTRKREIYMCLVDYTWYLYTIHMYALCIYTHYTFS